MSLKRKTHQCWAVVPRALAAAGVLIAVSVAFADSKTDATVADLRARLAASEAARATLAAGVTKLDKAGAARTRLVVDAAKAQADAVLATKEAADKQAAEQKQRDNAAADAIHAQYLPVLIAMIAASVGALGGVGAALIAFLQKSRENAWSVAKEAREEQRHEFAEIHGDKINQILSNQENLMSQVTNWAAQEEADLTTISTTLDGIVSGVAALDVLIANFQNSPGTLSPADQASLDAIQASVKLLVTKTAAIVVAPPVPVPPAV